MFLRQTNFGFHQGRFEMVTAFADTLVSQIENTQGLHSISLMKVGEDRGQILAFYKTKSDMEKGKGLYLNAFAGVSPWITLLPDAQEFEVDLDVGKA